MRKGPGKSSSNFFINLRQARNGLGKQNVRAAGQNDKLEFKGFCMARLFMDLNYWKRIKLTEDTALEIY